MRMNARMSADERRDEIVAAASIEFGTTGYAGTSTDSIARRAGVSQPYLFQLFGTKKELFIASVLDCFARTRRTFEETGRTARGAGLDTAATLQEMGHAYIKLLMADGNLLRLQLQAYAACQDDDVRAVVRDNYMRLWSAVGEVSGADEIALQSWFAQGMLINVAASIGEGSTFESFLSSCLHWKSHPD
jgi:AcrR family transcriptional regulator